MFAFDMKKQEWHEWHSTNEAPVSRCNSMHIVRKNLYSVIFAGFNNAIGYFNDMHQFDTEKREWAPIAYQSKAVPEPRCAFAFAYCTVNDTLWIHGGAYISKQPLDDLWCFSFTTRHWQQIEYTRPSSVPTRACAAHSMTMHGDYKCYLNISANELDELDLRNHKWTVHPLTKPQAMYTTKVPLVSALDMLYYVSHVMYGVQVGMPNSTNFLAVLLHRNRKFAHFSDLKFRFNQ